jgi:hypothetical protein
VKPASRIRVAAAVLYVKCTAGLAVEICTANFLHHDNTSKCSEHLLMCMGRHGGYTDVSARIAVRKYIILGESMQRV